MSEESKKQEELAERREARRRRRQRNQILAYLVVIVFIIVLAAGIVAAVNYLSNRPEQGGADVPQSTEVVQDTEESSSEEESSSSIEESSVEESTEPEPEVVELTYEQKLDQIVNAAIEVMPIEDKVAGLFMVTPELLTGVNGVTKAGESTKAALSKYAVGGILYYSQNVKNKEAFMTMIENTVLYSKYPVFLAMEEEGGKRTQLSKVNTDIKTDSAKDIAATGDTQNAYQTAVTIGTYMKELGLNMNLAPVADLANVEKSLMADRSYGSEADAVSGYVLSAARGLSEQGILSCVKHFPGMGSVTTDTDKGVVVTEHTAEEFWDNEMVLFQKLVDEKVPSIMVSNLSAPALTGDNTPCTLSSKVVTDILRNQMGYDGLVITDALNEKAVADYHSADEAAILALKAGCDMILCPENLEEAYNGVLQAVQNGTISEERVNDALRRIYRIKFADRVE